jgi:hypothetical protein
MFSIVTADEEREEETMIENQKASEKAKEKEIEKEKEKERERERQREREKEGDRENEAERSNERGEGGEGRKRSHPEGSSFSLISSTEKGYALDVMHARNAKRMNGKGSDNNSNNNNRNNNSNSYNSSNTDRGGMITDADYEAEEPRRSSRNRFLALEKSCALKGFDVYGRPLSLREKGDRVGSSTGIDGEERDFLESAERGDSSLYQQSVLGIGYGPDGPYMLHENSAINVDEEDGLRILRLLT